MTQKVYEKPDVMEIVYEMDSNIAGGCDTTSTTFSDYDECVYEEGGWVVFLGQCDLNADDFGFCYQVPLAGDVIFSS